MAVEITVRELFELTEEGTAIEKDQVEDVFLQGWIRKAESDIFFLNDGTYFQSASVIPDSSMRQTEIREGHAARLIGRYVLNEDGTSFSILCRELIYDLNPEMPDMLPHGVPVFQPEGRAVTRIRSTLVMAVHEFFQSQGFVFITIPYHADWLESRMISAYVQNFRDVYAFGPRKSDYHSAELVQASIAFADLDDAMDLAEDLLRFCVNYALENCPVEFSYLEKERNNGLVDRLRLLMDVSYERPDTDLTECGVPCFLSSEPEEKNRPYLRADEQGQALCRVLSVPEIGVIADVYEPESDIRNLSKQAVESLHPWAQAALLSGPVHQAGVTLEFEKLVDLLTGHWKQELR